MRIVIVGGGPSGAFCAMGLLAAHGRQAPEVLIFDRRIFGAHGPRGCNLCAGVISNTLVETLDSLGLTIPAEVVQNEIHGYHLVSRSGSMHLRKHPRARIFTAFRALGPPDSGYSEERSFDHFLLQTAVGMGAQHVREIVEDVVPLSGRPGWRIEYGAGKHMDADIVVIACGVHTAFLHKVVNLGFGYVPPATIHACQAEIPLDPQAVTECFQQEIKIFALGLPGVRFAAMTPKERHVTVTLVGAHVKREHLEAFLQLLEVRRLFPQSWRQPISYCHCHPKIPVSAGKPAASDHLVIVGDAHVSRYLKNGLVSAFQTGMFAARAILETGGELSGLRREYLQPCRDFFRVDNMIGRLLFKLHDYMAASPRIARALVGIQRAEEEKKREAGSVSDGVVTRVLWNMFTGDLPYLETLKYMLHPQFALRLAADLIARGR